MGDNKILYAFLVDSLNLRPEGAKSLPHKNIQDAVRAYPSPRSQASEEGNPNICQISHLHALFRTPAWKHAYLEEGCETARVGCGECKKVLIESILNILETLPA